jgi:hypothetical protein
MTGEPRLYVHGVTAKEWADRHRIEVFSHPCIDCGRPRTISMPFAQGELRGLQAPPCDCGNDQGPYGLVRAEKYGDLFTGCGGRR